MKRKQYFTITVSFTVTEKHPAKSPKDLRCQCHTKESFRVNRSNLMKVHTWTDPHFPSLVTLAIKIYSQTPRIRPSLIRLNGSPLKNGFWLIRLSSNPPKFVQEPMGADWGGLTV